MADIEVVMAEVAVGAMAVQRMAAAAAAVMAMVVAVGGEKVHAAAGRAESMVVAHNIP